MRTVREWIFTVGYRGFFFLTIKSSDRWILEHSCFSIDSTIEKLGSHTHRVVRACVILGSFDDTRGAMEIFRSAFKKENLFSMKYRDRRVNGVITIHLLVGNIRWHISESGTPRSATDWRLRRFSENFALPRSTWARSARIGLRSALGRPRPFPAPSGARGAYGRTANYETSSTKHVAKKTLFRCPLASVVRQIRDHRWTRATLLDLSLKFVCHCTTHRIYFDR